MTLEQVPVTSLQVLATALGVQRLKQATGHVTMMTYRPQATACCCFTL